MLRFLVVDDDPALRLSIKSTLLSNVKNGIAKYSVEEATDGQEAVDKFKESKPFFDVILLDVDLPKLKGLQVLKAVKEIDPSVIVLMMTAYANVGDAVQAVKDGAYNYVSKPVSGDDLLEMIEKALRAQNLISRIAISNPVMVESGRRIIGHTDQMQKVFNIIHKLAKVDTPVLIRGASGTGKELVARAIHFNSARKDEKFVAINCSAIPETLFESELFGHEKGSFTGAHERKIGKFQYAEGGTLFLDEVGDMPPQMQVKLLRILQEKTFTPVGSLREIPTNVRILAATNRPLEEMFKTGAFREDLFYRLNVVPIFLPSLAARKDDLEKLITIFIKKFNEVHKKRMTGISADALALLKKYDWPGNIRELENVIEHSFVLESSQVITLSSLPEKLLEQFGIESSVETSDAEFEPADLETDDDADQPSALVSGGTFDFNLQKEAFEKEFIIKALKAFKGRINQTALHANIPKKTLLRKIEKYGINAKDYME